VADTALAVFRESKRVRHRADDARFRVRGWHPPTVADCLAAGNDNFVQLRLLAATLVIYAHCWPLGNSADVVEWVSRTWTVFAGTVAVDAFFFISGLLITMSYVRRASVRSFVRARALRIYPALVVCVVFCALLGAAVTTLPLRAYFVAPRLYQFIVGNASLARVRPHLPGVFATNRHARIVNGSLWTLPAELQMYGYVALLGVLGILRSKTRFACTLAVLLVLGTMARDRIHLVSLEAYEGFATYFAAGAGCWMFRDRVVVSGALLAMLIMLCVATRSTAAYPPVFAATIVYFCLWFAFVPRMGPLTGVGDYSYGLYLYGFPIQQLVAWRLPELGPWPLLLVSLPLAFVLAAASWHCVEKPALARK